MADNLKETVTEAKNTGFTFSWKSLTLFFIVASFLRVDICTAMLVTRVLLGVPQHHLMLAVRHYFDLGAATLPRAGASAAPSIASATKACVRLRIY